MSPACGAHVTVRLFGREALLWRAAPERSWGMGGGAYLAAWARCSRFCVATSAPSPTPSLPADQLDPEAPALPQLYGDKDGHLLLVFLEDAARLLFTDDSHVTGFKASAPKAKQKKRGRGRAEEEDEEASGEDQPEAADRAPKRKQPRCKTCGGPRKGHKRGECPPPADQAEGDSD